MTGPPLSPDSQSVYLDGVVAGKAGDPPTVCPHPAGSVERTLWLRGLTAGRAVAAGDAPAE